MSSTSWPDIVSRAGVLARTRRRGSWSKSCEGRDPGGILLTRTSSGGKVDSYTDPSWETGQGDSLWECFPVLRRGACAPGSPRPALRDGSLETGGMTPGEAHEVGTGLRSDQRPGRVAMHQVTFLGPCSSCPRNFLSSFAGNRHGLTGSSGRPWRGVRTRHTLLTSSLLALEPPLSGRRAARRAFSAQRRARSRPDRLSVAPS